MKFLIWGHTGFVGSRLLVFLEKFCQEYDNGNNEFVLAKSRLDNFAKVQEEVETSCVNAVINVAGLTGRPNVDWCETHREEVTTVNTIGATVLATICHRLGIHYTYIGTGCIYEYDEEHPMPKLLDNGQYQDVPGFTEEDEPNFNGSFYSRSKKWTEKIVKQFSNALILRIRMPISDDLSERSFITKISKYEKVVNIPNSMTVLSDLLPLIPQMIADNRTGIYNFVNPGVISHNQILDLYREYLDDTFTYTNFSLEDQAKILKAGRSNNYLSAEKLSSQYEVPSIMESIHKVFERIAALR